MSARAKQAIPRLFISYSHIDAAKTALRLADDLKAKGFDVWLDLERSKPGASWTRGIEQGIDHSHVVLAILSKGSFTSEICRAEQLRALRKKKRVLPVVVQEDADIPVHLETEHYVRLYEKTYQDGLKQLQAAIHDDTVTALLHKQYKNHYRTYPPLPQHFLPRPELLEALRHEIINEGDGARASLIAIRGMGGVGKTVLAQAACHDEAVRDAFPDGVLWANVGRSPKNEHLCEQIRELAKALDDTLESYDTLQGCQNQLRTTLSDRSALIVLDDVWDPNHVQLFNVDAPRCRLLLTTRSQAVVTGTNAREFPVQLMGENESRELLARKSGLNRQDLPPEAAKIVQRCAGLPLALSMLGARARKGGSEWARIVDALDRGKAERVSLKLSDYRYANLYETTQVSIESLPEEFQLRYLDLAVFPANTPIPQKVLETLWGLTGDDVDELVESWVEASLASRVETQIVLHDLQLDYVRKKAGDTRDLHRRLLDAYRIKAAYDWPSGPDDGYYFSQLKYHMLEAGETIELRRLLLNPEWIRARLEKKGISSLLADYDLPSPDPVLVQVQQALQLSAHVLSRSPDQIAGQTFGRLRSCAFGEIQEFLARIRNTESAPWLEPLGQSLWQPGAVLVCTLAGHSGAIKAIAMQMDGKRVVTASDDHTLKAWNIESGTEVFTLRGHRAPVNAVALSRDGRIGVSTSYDRTMKVWDLETGAELRTLTGDSHLVNAVALTADGKRLVSASYTRQIKVWDLGSGTELHTLAGHTGWVNSVVITPDSRYAISASQDKTMKVWDLETGTLVLTMAGHSESVNDAVITPDGKKIVSISSDMTLKVWDLKTGAHLRALAGHTGAVTAVAITEDGEQAISASEDNTVRVWNLKSGELCRILTGHLSPVHALLLMRDGKRAISLSDDKSLKIWDLVNGNELESVAAYSGPVNAVLAASDGRRVVSINGAEGSTLKVWDFESKFDTHTLVAHSQMVNAVAISPDGMWIVSASSDKTLRVRELKTDRYVHTLTGHAKAVNSVAITPNGMRIVSASADATIKVWDLITGLETHTLIGHTRSIDHIAITADGKQVVSAACDRTLRLWDIDLGRELAVLTGHSGWVRHVVITKDGRRAVSASYDRTARIWNLQEGTLLHTLAGHEGWVNAVAVSSTGLVVSASYDQTLKVWDMESGKHIHTLSGHTSSVSAVSITADGKQAISASHDHTLKVWDLETGSHLHTFAGHARSVNAMAIVETRGHVVSASNDNTVRLWTMEGRNVASFSADGPVICVAVTSDGATMVAGDYLGRTHVLRVCQPVRG